MSGKLNEAEVALTDAISTVLEVIMTAGIAKPAVFDRMFAHQRDGYLKKRLPTAAAVAEMLRQFAVDPKREAHRQELRQILSEPPKGTA